MALYPEPNGKEPGYLASRVILAAQSQLGKPYVWGAVGPDSFDCSGLIMWACKQAGIPVVGRWTTYTMITQGDEVKQADMKPGDWVFPDLEHVGIYIGGNQMLHAPQPGDVVKTSSVYKFWRARRYYAPMTVLKGMENQPVVVTPGSVAGDILDKVNPFDDILKWMGDKNNWVRIGMGLGGGVALTLALISVSKRAALKVVT